MMSSNRPNVGCWAFLTSCLTTISSGMCPCMTPNISINNGGVTSVEGGVPPNRNDYQTEEEYMHEVDAYLNRQRFLATGAPSPAPSAPPLTMGSTPGTTDRREGQDADVQSEEAVRSLFLRPALEF